MSERSLFLSALEIEDAIAREAFLAEACVGNPQLRTEVEALLKSHGEAGAFLETPAAAPVMPTIIEGSQSASDQAEDDLHFLSPSSTPGSLGQLGHYEVKEVLGRGAFGIVLRAFDEKLHRMVAIKVMNPELAATSPPRKRFLREARSSASVRHENIVAIHAVEEQPIPYLVMEYIPGMTLQQRVDSHGPLDVGEVLRIGQQIATGLSAAHGKGLIHRDIKPANILIESGLEERAKITDFGLARAADDASLTQSGLIAGTPMYMAPEQAKGQPLDHRADLFSLGSVLYVMASGRPPFRAPNTIAVLKRVCEDTPRPIDEVIPETPPWLCDIIGKLLAKEPDDRFQTAKEVADVLGQHLAHWQQPQTVPRPAPVLPNDSARTIVQPVAVPRQPTLGLIVLMGTGLLLAVSVMFVAVWRGILKMQGDPLLGTVQTGVVFLTLMFLWVTAFAIWGFVTVFSQMRRNPASVVRSSVKAAASNAAVPTDRRRGTLSQAWHGWWSELDRWVTIGVQAVLLVAYLVCMLLFVSMRTTGGHDEEGNATFAYRLCAPDPWFQFDVHPEPLVPFRTGITFTASSVLIGLLGCLVYGIFWRIEKVRNPRTSKWNGPTFMLGIWGVGALGAVALGHWQGYAALAKPRLVVAAGGSDMPPASAPMPSAVADTPSAWQPLFNGRDLTGWTPHPQDVAWRVAADGVLTGEGQGHLFTQRNYANFHLRAEVRISEGGDSGLLFRCDPKSLADEYPVGFEAMINSTNQQNPRTGSLTDPTSGYTYGKDPSVPPDTWFIYEVIAAGDHITLKVNGATTLAGKHGLPQWPAGPVGLQLPGDGKTVAFRNLEIRELPTTTTPSPAIAPFTAAQAKQHQDAWAKHLGVPVEYTNSLGMKFRLIPPGEFLMGSTPEEIDAAINVFGDAKHVHEMVKSEAPQHLVVLMQPIYLGVHEVTQGQYEAVMGANPSHFALHGNGKAAVTGMDTTNHPVEWVSWNDAAEFSAKLSANENTKPFYFRTNETVTSLAGTGYRLPTEAEWEFACRAGTSTKYWIGDTDEEVLQAAWLGTNSGRRTHPVGELKANPFGLYDIHGNLNEWVQDSWTPNDYGQFQGQTAVNPTGPAFAGSLQVFRGGDCDGYAAGGRASSRQGGIPSDRDRSIGFRVALMVNAVKTALSQNNTMPTATTIGIAKRQFVSDEWIDVIPLIDPQLDKWDVPQRTGKNAWRMERGELVVGGDTLGSKLLLPLDSDWPAFECEFEFTRRIGNSGLNVNLPTKQGECPLVVDPPNNGGVFLGSIARGAVLATGSRLMTGRRATMRVQVRRQQDADRVSVVLNGATIGEWTGDRNAITPTYREGYPQDRRVSLFIQPGGNVFVFHRIRVRMLDGGTAETLRPIPSAEPASAPLPAVAPFDAAQANAHQAAWAKHLGMLVEHTDSLGMKFRLIPPGEFLMGSTEEENKALSRALEQAGASDYDKFAAQASGPQHRVRITQPFYCGVYEVTVGEYRQFIEATKYLSTMQQLGVKRFEWTSSIAEPNADRRAVIGVSWDDAQAFCQWRSQRDGVTYGLPSEAQWEYACRAGTTTLWSFGDDAAQLAEHAVFDREAFWPAEVVGSRKPNPFGLFDLHGNADEWCLDWHSRLFYGTSPVDDPACLENPTDNHSGRVARGGTSHSAAWWTRSTTRPWDFPATPANPKGFRVVITGDLTKLPRQAMIEAVKAGSEAVSALTPANVEPPQR